MRIINHNQYIQEKLSKISKGFLFMIAVLVIPFSWQNAFAQVGEWVELISDNEFPPEMADLLISYDSKRDVVILFSETFTDFTPTHSSETWEWDGNQWHFKNNTEVVLRNTAMAYDAKHDQLIRFGGLDSELRNITWLWDHENGEWIEISSEGPPPITQHQMVWDSNREVIVMHGGLEYVDGGWKKSNDTWYWDGSTQIWTIRQNIYVKIKKRCQFLRWVWYMTNRVTG